MLLYCTSFSLSRRVTVLPVQDPESIKKFIVYCMDAAVREGEKV